MRRGKERAPSLLRTCPALLRQLVLLLTTSDAPEIRPAPADCCLARLIEARAAALPAKIALRFPSPNASFIDWTYGELCATADALRHGLAARGAVRGDRALLLVRPSADAFALILALFRLGVVVLVPDSHMPRARLLAWARRLQPTLLVAPQALLVALAPVAWLALRHVRLRVWLGGAIDCCRCLPEALGGVSLQQLIQIGRATRLASVRGAAPDDSAFVVFTTGSTGPAKPVLISHGMIWHQSQAICTLFAVDDASHVALEHNFAFVLFYLAAGLSTTLAPLRYGDARFVVDADPAALLEVIEQHGISLVSASYRAVANVARHCVHVGRLLPRSVRLVLTFGAPVPARLHMLMHELLPAGARLAVPYGATEALPIACADSALVLGDSTRALARAGWGVCVGLPAPGCHVRIAPLDGAGPGSDDCDAQLGSGGGAMPQFGRVLVSGATVSPVYLADEAATRASKSVDAAGTVWHDTGDVGAWDAAGRLWYGGRRVHCLSVGGSAGGACIPPVVLEALATAHPSVFRATAVAVGERACLVLELESEARACGEAGFARIAAQVRELVRASCWARALAHAPELAVLRYDDEHAGVPVDTRHNSKVDYGFVRAWAERRV